ncbi:MAG: VCBS repeat-containing protein [Planctomycetes bacterium]|nr:VCBS repeat-containing protein [Planctomycetota bacterium]
MADRTVTWRGGGDGITAADPEVVEALHHGGPARRAYHAAQRPELPRPREPSVRLADPERLAAVPAPPSSAPQAVGSYAVWWSNPLAVGDFNGDGKADVAGLDGMNGFMPKIVVFMQQPNGSFTRNELMTGTDLAVGDFDGDGRDDLLIHQAPVTNVANVYWGQPTQTLTNRTTITTPFWIMRATALDLDLDGITDLLFHDGYGNRRIGFVRGLGSRSFGGGVSLLTDSSPYTFVAADLDADGDPDLMRNDGLRYENMASYGNSCGAPVTLDLATPTPGTGWGQAIAGAPAGSVGAMFLALAPQHVACGTLVDVSAMLAPALLFFTDGNGAAATSIPLPATLGYPGPYFMQAIVLDANGAYQRYGYPLSSSAGRAIMLF